jgi:hypothetical protein
VVDVVLVLVLMGRAKSTRLHVVFRGNVVPQLDSASGQSDEEQSFGDFGKCLRVLDVHN